MKALALMLAPFAILCLPMVADAQTFTSTDAFGNVIQTTVFANGAMQSVNLGLIAPSQTFVGNFGTVSSFGVGGFGNTLFVGGRRGAFVGGGFGNAAFIGGRRGAFIGGGFGNSAFIGGGIGGRRGAFIQNNGLGGTTFFQRGGLLGRRQTFFQSNGLGGSTLFVR